MPSRLFGVTVLAPVNAASAAISASMKSSLPRFLRTGLVGKGHLQHGEAVLQEMPGQPAAV